MVYDRASHIAVGREKARSRKKSLEDEVRMHHSLGHVQLCHICRRWINLPKTVETLLSQAV